MRICKYLLILLGIALVSSCEREYEGPRSPEDKNQDIVTFSPQIESRSSQEGTFEEGDAIGIFVYERGRSASPVYANVKYTYSSAQGVFKPEGTAIRQSAADYDIYVYYPYQSNATDPTRIAFSVQSQSNRDAWLKSDFLTASYKGEIRAGKVPLTFKHKLATLLYEITSSRAVSGVVMQGVQTSILANLLTDACATTRATANLSSWLIQSENGKYYYKMTVPVQTITASNQVTISLQDGAQVRFAPTTEKTLTESKITKLVATADQTTVGAWEFVRVTANPTSLPDTGGSSTLTYEIRRPVLVNNRVDHYETVSDGATLTSSNPAFTVNGNTVSVGANSGAQRSTTVTLTKDGVSTTITLTQNAHVDRTTYGAWEYYSLTKQGDPIGADGGTYSATLRIRRIVYEGNTPIDEEFDTVTQSGTAPANTGTGEKTYTLTLSARGVTRTATFTQAGRTVVEPSLTYGPWEYYTLTKQGDPIPASGGTYSATLRLRRIVYEGNTPINEEFDTVTQSGTAPANTGTGEKTYTLTLSARGVTRTATFTQAGREAIPMTYTFTIDNSDAGTLGYNSGNFSVSITSTKSDGSTTTPVGYSVTSKPSWVTVSGTSISFTKNSSESTRSGTVTWTQAESGKTVSVSFVQERDYSVGAN